MNALHRRNLIVALVLALNAGFLATTATANEIVECRDYRLAWDPQAEVDLPYVRGRCLAVTGDHAYVSGENDAMIAIFDITDPAAPFLAAQLVTPAPPNALAAAGDVLLALVPGHGLMRWDITDPVVPSFVDTVALGSDLRDVIIDGVMVYVSLGAGGVRAVTLEYPGLTVPMDQVATGGGAGGLCMSDGRLLVADTVEGLVVVEVADPTDLLVAARAFFPNNAYAVDARDGLAVVTGREVGGFGRDVAAYDVTDPWAPLLLAYRHENTPHQSRPRPWLRTGGRVLVSNQSSGLVEYQIDGAAILLRGADPGDHYAYWEDGNRFVSIGYTSLLSGRSGEMLGHQYDSVNVQAHRATSLGTAAYVARQWPGEVRVIDVADPQNLTETAELLVPDVTDAFHIAVAGGTLFVTANGAQHLALYDLTDPLVPIAAGELPLASEPKLLGTDGDLVYCAIGRDGLAVIDAGHPGGPTVLGTALPSSIGNDRRGEVAVFGDQVLVSGHDTGIDVFDVSDPTAPYLAETLTTDRPSTLVAAGDQVLAGAVGGKFAVWEYDAVAGWSFAGHGPVSEVVVMTVDANIVYALDTSDDIHIMEVGIGGGLPTLLYSRVEITGGRTFLLPGDGWLATGGIYFYTLPGQCLETTVAAPEVVAAAVPRLAPASPNPFNPRTVLSFSLPTAARAELTLFDLAGRKVRTLWSGIAPAGVTRVTWDGMDGGGRPAAAGVYLARLRAEGRTEVQKLALVR